MTEQQAFSDDFFTRGPIHILPNSVLGSSPISRELKFAREELKITREQLKIAEQNVAKAKQRLRDLGVLFLD